MLQETYGLKPRLLPQSLHDSYGAPKPKLPRVAARRARDELGRGDQGQGEISSPFEYAAHLTEVMLLGVVSLRAGGKIYYDGEKVRVTNSVKERQPER